MARNKLLEFLLDKKAKGEEMNIGEAMSKCDIWAEGKPGSIGPMMNMFREHWEENNPKENNE
tara:strand:- start:118 stop:303 length:186 start_codon:yes stop_codon:yes gene_type:complete